MGKKILFIIAMFTISCQNVEKNTIPETLYTEEQMVEVLTEVAVLKAIKTNYFKDYQSFGINSGDYLCKKYDIDSITLQENIKYYNYYPHRLQSIYERVKDSLELSKTTIKDYLKVIEKASKKKKNNLPQKFTQEGEASEDFGEIGEEEVEEEEFSNISSKVSQKRSAPIDLSKKTRK